MDETTNGPMNEEARAFAEALRAQNAGYGFLARLFRAEVDEETLADLRAMKLPAATGNERLDAGYRRLAAYLNGAWERTRTELAVDFFHTFIGTTQDTHAVAFPYESVYTSPDRLLMQDARDEVLAAYRAACLVLVDEVCEPEDHLSFELEFAQLLGARATGAFEAGDEEACARLLQARRAFMDAHLVNWVPSFADDVERIAQTEFYRALALVLRGVLEVDRAFLDEALAPAA
ncbi:TorD/DmsD family molecular chaperone [Eggerthella sinensis]|uniref:TorD/DmsD family molecular chaperone n=1 Tax=Eggerthella sinensis TaxID=242230 RepID=UPI0022E0447D|nr:molecular chaperone TorD family protein [Eggerthella sinensis]